MYRCLCVSMLFMVLIMIVFLSELGKYIDEDGNPILTSQQLRSMYVEGIVNEIFTNIYNGVIGSSIEGKTSVYFRIMCIQSQVSYSNNECNNYDGYQEWLRRKYGENIPKNNNKYSKLFGFINLLNCSLLLCVLLFLAVLLLLFGRLKFWL